MSDESNDFSCTMSFSRGQKITDAYKVNQGSVTKTYPASREGGFITINIYDYLSKYDGAYTAASCTVGGIKCSHNGQMSYTPSKATKNSVTALAR